MRLKYGIYHIYYFSSNPRLPIWPNQEGTQASQPFTAVERVMWPARKGLGEAVKWPFHVPTPNIAELCPRQLVLGVISLRRQPLKLPYLHRLS